jgi:hypothetical protein
MRASVSLLLIFVALTCLSVTSVDASDINQLIKTAGMTPWTWQAISLDEPLRRGVEGEKVPLRHFVTGDKPLLVYMYAYY